MKRVRVLLALLAFGAISACNAIDLTGPGNTSRDAPDVRSVCGAACQADSNTDHGSGG